MLTLCYDGARKIRCQAVFLAALLQLPASLLAQYTQDRHAVSGGSGVSSGGLFELSGVVGQTGTGTNLNNGGFALVTGFWSLLAAIPSPDAPTLSIFLTPTNTAIVSWPGSETAWVLEQAADLTHAPWLSATDNVRTNGSERFILVTPPPGQRFYRLRKP